MVECWAGHLFQTPMAHEPVLCQKCAQTRMSISGLVVDYIVAIDVTRARFPADALVPARRAVGVSRALGKID